MTGGRGSSCDSVSPVTQTTSVEPAAPIVLAAVGETDLSANVDRVVAAVGARMIRAETPTRRSWLAAAAVIVDRHYATACRQAGLPRRDGVLVVDRCAASAQLWKSAVEVGAEQVCALPAEAAQLLQHLADALEGGSVAARSGRVIGVTPGRGGAGASVFAAALAQCAGDALLVDIDPCGGGVDLLLGSETVSGLRWPDLHLHSGRLTWSAMRDVLPRRNGVSVLSGTRVFHDIEPAALAAVLDAGRRGGVTVLCDLPRQLTPAAVCALQYTDLVVAVTSCDVRGAAAAAATVSVLSTVNPAIGLVVRGPSPGGLQAQEVASAAAAPLLAAMRPEPALSRRLEYGGLRLRRRSPLALAARTVLDVVSGRAA